jgi:hypothetical protein
LAVAAVGLLHRVRGGARPVKIVAAAHRYEEELTKYLRGRADKLAEDILRGVPVAVYEIRCAELRSLRDVLAELPAIMKKAKD